MFFKYLTKHPKVVYSNGCPASVMRLFNSLNKILSVIATFALLFNSLSPSLVVLAQEATTTPIPEATPTDTPTPTEEPAILPSSSPTTTPEVSPSPTDIMTPTPIVTPTPDTQVLKASTPADTPVANKEPENDQTTTGPPTSDQPESTPEVTSETPTENGTISATILQDESIDTSFLDQFDISYKDEGSATISTDKLDYAPTDTAIITGSGFLPGKTYTIKITSSDEPAVDFSDSLTANDQGEITYSYTLDGNYRPDYKVEVKDGEVVIASTTFTDNKNIVLTISGTGGGSVAASVGSPTSCTSSCSITETDNNAVGTLIAVPNTGSIFAGWSLQSSGITGCSGNTCNFSMVNSAQSLTATFNLDVTSTPTLTITGAGTGTGIVTSNDAHFNCTTTAGSTSGSCSYTYDADNPSITLTPSASAGSTFTGWGGGGCTGSGTCDPTGLTGSNAVTVTASFSATPVAPDLNWPTTWTTPNSCVVDPSNDENPNNIDLVGSVGSPAVGFNYDANYQYFREKVFGDPGTAGSLVQKAWVVLFQTSTPEYQYLGSLNGHDNKVQLWVNSSASGPVDFNPLLNDPAESIVWEGDSGSYANITSAGGGEYYLDWAIPISAFTSTGIVPSTTKFFATSADANNFNKDHLKCYEALSDLSIVKADSPDPVINGGVLTYTLTVHNAGPDTASGVVVTDSLPSGYSITSVTPSQASCSDTTAPDISCELGSMTNGADATITIVGNITTDLSSVTNTTAVTLDTTASTDTNQSNNSDSEDTAINPATGTLTVVKNVINDNGGTKNASNFTINATGGDPSSFSGSEDGTIVTVSADGSYTVSEGSHDGYTVDYSTDCEGTMPAGGDKTCTITNDDIAPTLKLEKLVTNDNGGKATPDDWTLTAKRLCSSTDTTGTCEISNSGGSGDFQTAQAGLIYFLSESGPDGYTPGSWTCDGGGALTGNRLTLGLDENVTCSITNDDIAPILKLVKVVTNDNGGKAVAGDWTLNAKRLCFNGDISGTCDISSDGDADIFQTATAGLVYTLSESGPSGYNPGSWECDGGTLERNKLVLGIDEEVTCTITNDDVAPTLKLVKSVTNDDGGQSTPDDWTLTAQRLCLNGDSSGTCTISNLGGSGDFQTAQAGLIYFLSESGPDGYTAGVWSCDGGILNGNRLTLGLDENVICSIINDDIAPTLTLNKVVEGGDSSPGDWTLSARTLCVNGSSDPACGFSDSGDSTTPHTLAANRSYVLFESGPVDYTAGSWDCDNAGIQGNVLVLGLDQDVTCTITNTRDTGSLTVNKLVDSDGDGTYEGSNSEANTLEFVWGIDSDTPARAMGSDVELDTDSYTVTENSVTGYHFVGWYYTGQEGSCSVPDGDSLPVALNVTKGLTEITLCNARDTGSVIVHKLIDADGNIQTSDDRTDAGEWEFTVEGNGGDTNSSSSQTTDVNGLATFSSLKTGDYNVGETPQKDYELLSASCGEENGSQDGNTVYGVNVNSDEPTECTFINFALNPDVSITKSNDVSGGTSAGSTVTYTLTITNDGNIPLNGFTVQDVLPGGFTYVSGSTSGATTNDPSVNGSVLSWKILGTLDPGENLSLVYKVNTDSGLTDGIYTNFATCTTSYGREEPIDCNTTNSTVAFGSTLSYGGSLGGQVLGISTELPGTGSPTAFLALALGLLTGGFILKRKYVKN